MTVANASKDFTGTGAGDWVEVRGTFNISLRGDGVGTYKLEKSHDGGTTPIDVSKNLDGDLMAFDKETADEIALLAFEPEAGVKWRWNSTTHSSGTTTARISQ